MAKRFGLQRMQRHPGVTDHLAQVAGSVGIPAGRMQRVAVRREAIQYRISAAIVRAVASPYVAAASVR
ncbi:MAG: hypothetical protein WCA12_09495 [Burkholderiales bacterium]